MSDNEQLDKQNELLPGYRNIEQFTKDGYKILMEAIRNSNALPSGRDWNFYSVNESFVNVVNDESNRILQLLNSILRSYAIEGNIRNRGLEEKTELMIEANDTILERVANNVDEINGIRKTVAEPVLIQTVSAQLPINGSWNRANTATCSVSSSITTEPASKSTNVIRLLTAKNILRPQKFFKDKIINSSDYPWEPRIKEKPNSLKPLAIFLEETKNGQEYSHPYEFELDRFHPLPDQLKKEEPVLPLLLEDTPLVEISKPEQLDDLVETLRNCKEFAVDLEHHSYRSFMGITCLMQISTRDKDYIVDTLALRDKLYVLNEVFTKPSIVKILHGADMDILWLQRDLSLYIVNLFDTFQAAKQLDYPGLSLAYLMQKFCKFVPNKQFQLADWRIRPLPAELKIYAREDTHYLIYIYQMLKNELINKANGQDNLLLSVINSSTETCKKRYFKPVLREDSHLDFYRKCKRMFDNRQLYALRELYKWRDHISREEDESTGYVLPNHMLLQISESLPREMQGILACCNPIPPLVRANLLELHKMILRAREQPLEKPILKEDTRARGTTIKISKINVDSPLHCPHDLSNINEFRDNLPTLLGNRAQENYEKTIQNTLVIENENPIFSIFDTPNVSDNEDICDKTDLQNLTFLGPFERYKLVKPFIQAEEERLAAEKDEEMDKNSVALGSEEKSKVDARTDQERIESIRDHFLKLSKKAPPVKEDIPPNQTLLQMGGSKKRKRELTPLEEPVNDLCITIPNLNRNPNNRRKRKSSDMLKDNQSSKLVKLDDRALNQQKGKNGQKQKNKMWRNRNKKNRQKNNSQNQGRKQNGVNSTEQDCRRSDLSEQGPSGSYRQEVGASRRGYKQGSYGNKRRNTNFQRHNSQADLLTQNQEFVPYDYSSIDFRQFQGGAANALRTQEFGSKFRPKGKKKGKNKGNNNRSLTFGAFGKSRGSGR